MNLPKKFLGRHMCSMLQTIPSFQGGRDEDEEESDLEDDEERTELEENEELLERIMAMEAQTSNSENKMKSMNLTEVNAKNESWNLGFGDVELFGQEMFLAGGLGIGGGGGGSGGGREFNSAGSGGDGGDNPDVEGHYKKLVEENPGNPLFLRNYAQFLYQVSFVISLCLPACFFSSSSTLWLFFQFVKMINILLLYAHIAFSIYAMIRHINFIKFFFLKFFNGG